MRAGVADLPWIVDERVAASLHRRLESIRLLAASVDSGGLARTRLAFVVAVRQRKGWLALAPLLAGIAARLPERARWERC